MDVNKQDKHFSRKKNSFREDVIKDVVRAESTAYVEKPAAIHERPSFSVSRADVEKVDETKVSPVRTAEKPLVVKRFTTKEIMSKEGKTQTARPGRSKLIRQQVAALEYQKERREEHANRFFRKAHDTTNLRAGVGDFARNPKIRYSDDPSLHKEKEENVKKRTRVSEIEEKLNQRKEKRTRERRRKEKATSSESKKRPSRRKKVQKAGTLIKKPFQSLIASLEGKKEAQKEAIEAKGVNLVGGIVIGLINTAIVVIKAIITIVSIVVALISSLFGVAAFFVVLGIILVVVVIVVVATVATNPIFTSTPEKLVSLTNKCNVVISDTISEEWGTSYPLVSNLVVKYDGTDNNVSNYGAILAASSIIYPEEIPHSVLSDVLYLYTELEFYEEGDALVVNIKKIEPKTAEIETLFRESGEENKINEYLDLVSIYEEALEPIGGNQYQIFAMPPSFTEMWELPFVGGTIANEYGEEIDGAVNHELIMLFEDETDIKAMTTGQVSLYDAEDGVLIIQYPQNIAVELKGNIPDDLPYEKGTLFQSGDTLFKVTGDLSIKMTMEETQLPEEGVKDVKTGETIEVICKELDSSLYSVSPLDFCRYKVAKGSGVDAMRKIIIKRAASYVGTPYDWGGTTTKGLDCSGLVLRVFNEAWADFSYPKPYRKFTTRYDAAQMAMMNQGRVIFDVHRTRHPAKHRITLAEQNADIAKLKPGDLLFYWQEGSKMPGKGWGTDHATHVAIFYGRDENGEALIIHASGTHVQIMKMQGANSYYIWPGLARRLISD